MEKLKNMKKYEEKNIKDELFMAKILKKLKNFVKNQKIMMKKYLNGFGKDIGIYKKIKNFKNKKLDKVRI